MFDKQFHCRPGGLNRQFRPTSAEVDVVKAVAKRKTTKPGRFIDVDLIVLASLLLFFMFSRILYYRVFGLRNRSRPAPGKAFAHMKPLLAEIRTDFGSGRDVRGNSFEFK